MKRLLSVFLVITLLLGSLSLCAGAAESIVLGDVSGDGVVSTRDVQQVLSKKYSEENAVIADYDFSGVVNKTDALSVLKCAAGIILPQVLEFEAWLTEKAPNCKSSGLETSLCKAKNIKRTRTLPKLEHSFVGGVCSACGWEEAVMGRISVNSKTVNFGDSIAVLTATFGTPTEILTDKIPSGTVKYYVYAGDYKNLAIFTCSDKNGVEGIYTTSRGVKITLTEVISFNNVAEIYSMDGVEFQAYKEGFNNDYPYALYATKQSETRRMYLDSKLATQEKLIFHALNATRAINGKAPLVYDAEFAKVAFYHSKDMADNNYFAHTSPSGEEFSHRLEMFGYPIYYAGENIALANIVNAYYFNDLWYNSEGHRENMLYDQFTNIGIGVVGVYRSEYGVPMFYATENFRWDYDF